MAMVLHQILGFSFQVIKDPDLRERHLGDLQGLVHHEAVKLCPQAYRALSSRRTDQEIPVSTHFLFELKPMKVNCTYVSQTEELLEGMVAR